MIYMFTFGFIGTILATFLGALSSIYIKRLNKKFLSFFQNFSLGGIITLTFLELFPEALESFNLAVNNSVLSATYVVLIALGVGALFFLLHEATHLISKHHDHDEDDKEDCHDHAHLADVFKEKSSLLASFTFLGAIFVHNIPEGLSLGISFIDDGFPVDGTIMMVVLFIHNLIIGLSMCTSFLSTKRSNGFCLGMTTLSALPAYIFSIVGFFISSLNLSDLFNAIIFAVSTGSLLYVIFIELLPQALEEYKSRYTFLFVLLGIGVSAILISL